MNHTASKSRVIVDPFFLDSPSGRLFAVHHRPLDLGATRGHILCVPPFNEEMNRCRSMVSLQAQAFAEQGIGTLMIDLFGTGDSAGEYVDARWTKWQADISAAINWLNRQPGGCHGLWGIRLGGILAAGALSELANKGVLVLWQPVVEGKQHFTQFLRMRIAAQMERATSAKETTNSMRDQLAAGKSLEVSGYEIHPNLAVAIDTARLDSCAPPPGVASLWLEQAQGESDQPSPASQRVIDAWRRGGVKLDVTLFAGPNFWQVAERAIATDAIGKTADWLKETWPV